MEIVENTDSTGEEGAAVVANPRLGARFKESPFAGSSSHGPGLGVWMFLILACFGFGGGLLIAFFGFNDSEASPRVAAVRSEILYSRPISGSDDGNRGTPELGARESVFGDVTITPLEPIPENTAMMASGDTTLSDLELNRNVAKASERVLGRSLGDGVTPSLFASLPPAEATRAAFEAIVLPSVPEPSTWAMLGAGLVCLLGLSPRRLRG